MTMEPDDVTMPNLDEDDTEGHVSQPTFGDREGITRPSITQPGITQPSITQPSITQPGLDEDDVEGHGRQY